MTDLSMELKNDYISYNKSYRVLTCCASNSGSSNSVEHIVKLSSFPNIRVATTYSTCNVEIGSKDLFIDLYTDTEEQLTELSTLIQEAFSHAITSTTTTEVI